MTGQNHLSFTDPPEGVLAGEDVPRENLDYEESGIQHTVAALKLRGVPYTEMNNRTLRRIAIEIMGD